MKAVLALAVLLAVVAVTVGGRWPTRWRDEYEYDYWGRMRPAPCDDRMDDSSEENSSEEDSQEDDKDDHVYRFAMGKADHGAYIYHDEAGHAKGFNIDLMHKVCEMANKTCYFTLDKGSHCWYNEDGHEYPGMGLMAGWFDACMGFFPTVERMNSFDFTKSFTENMKVAVYYRTESGLMPDVKVLSGHRIGFVSGWSTSQTCLHHATGFTGNHIGEYTPVMYPDFKTMVEAAMKNEVDAILAPKALGLEDIGLKKSEPYFYCSTDGAAVMAPYGSDLLNWWDMTFNKMKKTGEFDTLCTKAKQTHRAKGEVHCHE